MVERDRELEEQLLFIASHRQVYRREVTARLDKFEEDNGGNLKGWDQDLDRILAEAQEEAADISGWLIGAGMKLDTEKYGRVIAAMRLAALASEQIEELRLDLVMEARSGQQQQQQ